MNQDWIDYLTKDGARIVGHSIKGFERTSSPKATSAQPMPALAALTDLGVVRVAGEDSMAFLESHFCNDVSSLMPGDGQLNGYCSPKGRLLAVFHLLRSDNDYLLVMPEALIATIVKRLSMFAQMARPVGKQLIGNVSQSAVSVTDCSDEILVMGIQGQQSLSLVQPEILAVASLESTAHADSRYLVVVNHDRAEQVWSSLKSGSEPVSSAAWRLLDIVAGLPTVLSETSEAFVPQMINMHLLNGLSFSKGCYPGQEIVARMHYLGKLKRRMYRFSAAQPDIVPGTTIVTATDAAAGSVVQSALDPQSGESQLLAVVKVAALETTLYLGDLNGAVLTQQSLPYSLESTS